MRTPILFLAFATLALPLVAAEGGAVVAVKDGVPGGVFAQSVRLEGTVTAIDPAARVVIIKGSAGNSVPVKVGPEAVNFPQIKVGDIVRFQLTEQLVVAMVPAEAAAKDGAAAGAVLAPEGAKPAGVAAQTTRVTATVTAIDAQARTATLTFADGTARTVRVRPDVDLAARKVGEKVSFTLTESIAVSVEKP